VTIAKINTRDIYAYMVMVLSIKMNG